MPTPHQILIAMLECWVPRALESVAACLTFDGSRLAAYHEIIKRKANKCFLTPVILITLQVAWHLFLGVLSTL